MSSNKSRHISSLYIGFAKIRRREYAERITNVDDGDFTPMIISSSGGMGPEMQVALKYVSRKIAEKQGDDNSKVAGLVRCKFSFPMIRSALVCLRGTRSYSKGCLRQSSGRG